MSVRSNCIWQWFTILILLVGGVLSASAAIYPNAVIKWDDGALTIKIENHPVITEIIIAKIDSPVSIITSISSRFTYHSYTRTI